MNSTKLPTKYTWDIELSVSYHACAFLSIANSIFSRKIFVVIIKMSWNDYLSTQLLQKHTPEGAIDGCVEHAAILGLADGAAWAVTPAFSLQTYDVQVRNDEDTADEAVNVNEAATLIHAVNNLGASLTRAGLRINNEKYFLVGMPDGDFIYLKKQGGGACIAKTNTGIIFASWHETKTTNTGVAQNPGLCNDRVESLAAYLKQNGI